MTAYYNEIEPFAADTLEELIRMDLIAPGVVDRRDIMDVLPSDLDGFTQCHFFAGVGIWSLALREAGWNDDRPVWTGSCPCQPFSAAGAQIGFDDERHLWPAFNWLIGQKQPVIIFGEQVASAKGFDWLDIVSTDLERKDYETGALDLCAAGFQAPHIRQRLFWVAYAKRYKQSWQEPCSRSIGRMGRFLQSVPWDRDWQTALTEFRSMDDGHTRMVGATDAFRNAIVAPVAKAFIQAVIEEIAGI